MSISLVYCISILKRTVQKTLEINVFTRSCNVRSVISGLPILLATRLLELWVLIPQVGCLFLCLFWIMCVVRLRSLLRTDPSSRGILPSVVSVNENKRGTSYKKSRPIRAVDPRENISGLNWRFKRNLRILFCGMFFVSCFVFWLISLRVVKNTAPHILSFYENWAGRRRKLILGFQIKGGKQRMTSFW
jgi:hypothetical protein